MNRPITRGLIACLSVVALASCQDYEGGFSESQIKEAAYAKNFVKAFGEIDPNQDWDLFGQMANGQNSMTRAVTPAPILGNVDISDVPATEYAYLTKSEAERYQMMLPESNNNALPYDETNLGRVVQNFKVKTQRFVLYPVHWNTSGSDVVGFYYHVPQGTTDAVEVTDVNGNPNYICKVQFYENKTHLYYTADDEYGYVYYGNDAYSRILSFWDQLQQLNPDLYIEEEGVKKVKVDGIAYALSTNLAYDPYSSDLWNDLVEIDPVTFIISDGTIKDKWGYNTYDGAKLVGLSIERNWNAVGSQDALSVWTLDNNPAKMLQSRGIVVTLPESAEIGMYITNGTGSGAHTFYSESKLNEKTDWGGSIGEKESCFVATYLDTDKDGNAVVDKDGNQIRYLCFEDWYGVKNFDLNDVVFRVYGFDGPGAEVVDNDSYDEEALLVCEDLGDFDYDFNDVVLKLAYHKGITRTTYYKNNGTDEVDHVDIDETANVTVTAMAAGGANESTITLNKKTGAGVSHIDGDGEIHKLLNGNAPSILNAGPSFGGAGKSVTIDADDLDDWDKTHYTTYLSQLFDTDFVTITTEGGTIIKKTTGTAYTQGMKTSPTMLLLPMSFEWPTENTLICDAYSGFSTWVSDATATDWISTKDDSKVTKR